MAKFELSIYGENDEVLKTYKTDHIRYGLFEDAIKIQEENKEINSLEKIRPIILGVFKGLTSEELRDADFEDIINIFRQVISTAQILKVDNNSDNNSTEKN